MKNDEKAVLNTMATGTLKKAYVNTILQFDDYKIYIFDEPFNGLDKNAVQKTYELIKQLKDKGKIIILASHHSQDIEYLCDFVFELMQGKLYVRR